jgi:hypothetical protein
MHFSLAVEKLQRDLEQDQKMRLEQTGTSFFFLIFILILFSSLHFSLVVEKLQQDIAQNMSLKQTGTALFSFCSISFHFFSFPLFSSLFPRTTTSDAKHQRATLQVSTRGSLQGLPL